MSKPLIHSKISVKKFGGKIQDYQKIHDWFDQTKAHIPDARHRALLHNSFGIFLCEQIFGELVVDSKGQVYKMPYITNSDGIQVSVRDIGEQHCLDDLGFIPTLEQSFKNLPIDADLKSGMLAKIKLGNFIIID